MNAAIHLAHVLRVFALLQLYEHKQNANYGTSTSIVEVGQHTLTCLVILLLNV